MSFVRGLMLSLHQALKIGPICAGECAHGGSVLRKGSVSPDILGIERLHYDMLRNAQPRAQVFHRDAVTIV